MNDISIDVAIEKLQQLKTQSPFGGNTALALCLVDSGVECFGIDDIILDKDQDGATVLVKATIGDFSEQPSELDRKILGNDTAEKFAAVAPKTDKRAIVVVGNPFDGLTVYGPFPSMNDAVEWASNSDGNAVTDLKDVHWTAVEIESPYPDGD